MAQSCSLCFLPQALLECGRSRGLGLAVDVVVPTWVTRVVGVAAVSRLPVSLVTITAGLVGKWAVEGSLFWSPLSYYLVPYVYW